MSQPSIQLTPDFAIRRLRIVLVAPRIAANVGNIARTATSLGAELHMVGPFGFFPQKEKDLKRTSVGYFDELQPIYYRDFEDFWQRFERSEKSEFYFATKRGETAYSDYEFGRDICLIFGNEEEGVPQNFWEFKGLPKIQSCRIPTVTVRCLNLATSVGIIGFEVFRQWGKQGSPDLKGL
ncbi:MAG: tRNA (uridine(34)/cytosine(34)/5-carboxymethylaminomethyluridine(34)-2'-O)-methyltransferase TrmL [Deltaproteobacteria bacterium]|nr:tRNA (uridine(34)/cytosine(34)/5-carboxymethylaminomethyluridine(34)-2'-O)-methyltransferase TrmL [Deltaproteobacteria bacterium]